MGGVFERFLRRVDGIDEFFRRGTSPNLNQTVRQIANRQARAIIVDALFIEANSDHRHQRDLYGSKARIRFLTGFLKREYGSKCSPCQEPADMGRVIDG